MSEIIPIEGATLDLKEFSSRVAFLNFNFDPSSNFDPNIFSGSTLIPQNIYNHTPVINIAKEFLIRTKLFTYSEGPDLEKLLEDYSTLMDDIPKEEVEALDTVFKNTYLDKYYSILNDVVYDYSMYASALKLRELKNFLNFLVWDSIQEDDYLNESSE